MGHLASTLSTAAPPNPGLAGVVHVIDDDAVFRTLVADLLGTAGLRAELHATPDDFLARPADGAPACILLDIAGSRRHSPDAQAALRVAKCGTPIILVAEPNDVPAAVRGMKAGALDVLPKPLNRAALLAAIAAALIHDAVDRGVRDRLAAAEARYATLTTRERQVMALVCEGLMNKQIAGRMNLSEITAKVHRGRMMQKMAVRTVADLVRLAERLPVEEA